AWRRASERLAGATVTGSRNSVRTGFRRPDGLAVTQLPHPPRSSIPFPTAGLSSRRSGAGGKRLPDGFCLSAKAPRGLTYGKKLCVMSGGHLPCVLRVTARH